MEEETLKEGLKAPNIQAKIVFDSETKDFDLYQTLEDGKTVMLVFYPGDDTPGCTKQLCGVRDTYKEYQDLDVEVVGVNPGGEDSHRKFIQKYGYQFGIVIDEGKKVRADYGAERKFFKNMITKRGVFVIKPDKTIAYIKWGQQDNQKVIDLIKNFEK